MAADSGQIVGRIGRMHEDFQELVDLVTGPEAAKHSAAEMELRLFRELLAMGRRLLELFFFTRAAHKPEPPIGADSRPLADCHLRSTAYLSVFGKIRFKRHRFFGRGQPGISPLDAELALPRRCYSDVLRDWVGHELVDAAYDQGARTIERILGISLSKNALETLVVEDSEDVDAFYDQKAPPANSEEGPLLVVQADGAGVRLVGTGPSERTGHRTSKREAVVTSIYTVDRHVRSARSVAEALLRDEADADAEPAGDRPAPVGKETRATLRGKDAAFERLRRRVAQRDGEHIQERVALTDGAEPLQERVLEHLPDFTLVLDVMHVLEYLWAASQAVPGNWRSDACHSYVRAQFEALLSGQTGAVVDDLRDRTAGLSAHRREPVEAAIRYFTRNAPYMRYDLYLSRGWPIATGVIEGGCKHLVRGRMEGSGMKWARPGAEAMLQLRAARINHDWDAYQRFRCLSEQSRLYGTTAPITYPEFEVLDQAA